MLQRGDIKGPGCVAALGKKGLNPVAQGKQAGIATDGYGPAAHQLEAVFVRRVMTARDHDARPKGLICGGIIDFFRAAHAYVRHLRPGLMQTQGQRISQFGAGKPGITSNYNTFCTQYFNNGPAQCTGQRRVENTRHTAPDIVGFEA